MTSLVSFAERRVIIMKERQIRNQSTVQKLKKTSWIFAVGLLFVFFLAGCGQSESFSPSTGSAEAKIVDVFAEKGLEVTNITDTGELSYTGDPEVSVTANSDLDDDGLKKIFEEGYGAGALGMAVFTDFEGENGDVLWVNEIVINDVKYTREGFTFQPDYLSEEFNFKNILADGKMFLEDETYQDYLAQQKAEEEEINKKSDSASINGLGNSSIPKDEKIVDTDGKTIYKVHSTGVITFTGAYKGSGNFIIKILDSNQDLQKLVCNEIGDYVLDNKVVSVGEGVRYIQVECSYGSWNMTWTGTGGN